jgi:nitrogen fixation protein FixH
MNNSLRSSKIPYIFIIFFVVFISVDLLYIYISSKTWRGTVGEYSYEKGIDYNQFLELRNKQNKLGWNLEINFKNLGNKRAILTIQVTDKDNKKLNDSKIEVKFERPTQEGFDFSKNLEKSINGKYQAIIDFPLRGQWNCEIIVSNKNDILQEVKKYVIQ